MSDIRKEFEEWESAPKNKDWNHMPYPAFCGGFQAGRAHDIEGLIAALREREWVDSNDIDAAVYVDDIEEIIRKHFGKE